jgi:hypothetical protein
MRLWTLVSGITTMGHPMSHPAGPRRGVRPQASSEAIQRLFFQGEPGPSGPSAGGGKRICDIAQDLGLRWKSVQWHLNKSAAYRRLVGERRARRGDA